MSIQPHNSDYFLRRVEIHQRLTPTIILHYNPTSRELEVWFWPVTEAGSRVVPSDLLDHRIDFDFRAPCCLCASNNGARYTESAIYVAVQGNYSGEYVAGCARSSCGYLISLERLYPKRGLLVQRYPVRPSGAHTVGTNPRTFQEANGSENMVRIPSAFQARDLNRGSAELFASIATYERPARTPRTVLDRLIRLDSCTRPGISEAEFHQLFAKCRCGLVTTRRVFRAHVCTVPTEVVCNQPVVIDLTSEDNDESVAAGPSNNIIIDLTADSDDEQQ